MSIRSPAQRYAELHAISNFSFLRGASHPEELVSRAAELGYTALAITDECSLAGVVRAHVVARQHAIKLIVGTEIHLDDGPSIVMLAPSVRAYQDLSELITLGRRRSAKGEYSLSRQDIEQFSTYCIGLLLSPTGYALASDLDCAWFKKTFAERGWLSVELLLTGNDTHRLHRLGHLARRHQLRLVATGDVYLHQRSRLVLQHTLTAIRLRTPVARVGYDLMINSERCLRPLSVLQQRYPRALLDESDYIASLFDFSLDELRYQYPEELVPGEHSAKSYLRYLTEHGIRQRWPQGESNTVRSLVEHELALINELDYERYFLTVYDIVAFARSQNILCQGRGSAANSAVCFCLGITEVDPARMNLLFERFISKERNEPPDIDVDFEHERREEVIQYIYQKYGRERAALAATVITYRPKSALRDVGKALGLSLEQVDRLAGNISWWDGKQVLPERIREAGFDPDNTIIKRMMDLVNLIIGFPRHLSQHVGGFVIANDKLSRLVPIENAAMPERTVIQWDKDDIEALGLLKVDCLGLGMLSAIRRCFDMIKDYRDVQLTMADLPAEDPAVYHMIQQADTVGVFQIESRAQMSMLPRLKPANFYDLVIEVAIVRPGPIQGDMVHPYLRRRQGLEKVSYPSEEVKAVLERTLGVPIFQEQVIKLAMVAAGFSPGEADGLRRSMAAWKRKGGLEQYEKRLTEGMSQRGYAPEFAQRIFQQILGFGEYGFPESHAASFSLLVYVSAWLKHHEPAAFTAALLNSQPMGFYAPAQLIGDAKRHEVIVRPIDVCISHWDCTLEYTPFQKTMRKPVLRIGLRLIKGLSQAAAQRIINARTHRQFSSVDDLSIRASLNRGDMEALAAADALSSLAGDRHQARWQTSGIEPVYPVLGDARIHEGAPLLRAPGLGESVVADYVHTGLSLKQHPVALLRHELNLHEANSAERIKQIPHGTRVYVAGLVITRQRPASANNVAFVTLEDETGHVNVVVWRTIAEKQRRELTLSKLMGVYGEVQREENVIHVIAEVLEDLTPMLQQLVTVSDDETTENGISQDNNQIQKQKTDINNTAASRNPLRFKSRDFR